MYATDTDRAALAGIGARLREARDRRGLTENRRARKPRPSGLGRSAR